MKATTVKKIFDKGEIVIGKYTYKADYHTGNVLRCKTEEIGKQWFGWDGQAHDGWETIIVK